MNEFRFAHAPKVIDALRGALADAPVDELLTWYQAGPDPALLGALARYAGAPSTRHVLAAAGSDEVLRAVLDTSGLRGHRRLLMGVPGYTHFEHYARLRGLEVVAYPIGLATPAADHLAALRYHAAALSEGCLVYLCSPNNPTGDMWEAGTVEGLAREFPRSLFLVDEAYVEFAACHETGAPAQPSCRGAPSDAPSPVNYAALLNARSLAPVAVALGNVIVTRTLSKAFGLAALRVGYAVGTPETIGVIGVAVSPKALSPLAGRVAVAALESLDHYWHATAAAKLEARRVVADLAAAGWWALDTPGNFYLVYVGDAAGTAAKLAAAGVQVRNRDDLPGLAGFVRLTAGTLADGRAVVSAFSRLTPPESPPPQTLYAPKGLVAAVKTLMRQTVGILAAARVQVWAQGGTLLGMVRHRSAGVPGGMVPTDDDADLAYLRTKEVDPLASLVDAFAESGLTLQRNRTDAYWQCGTNLPGTPISPAHVDIFSYRLVDGDGGARYVVDDPRFQREDPSSSQAHCNTSYRPEELFPLSRDRRFYDLIIPVPAQAETVLKRALGDDFMQVMRARTSGGLVEVHLKDYTPA